MRRSFAAVVLFVPLVASCAPVDGVLTRYRLERELWRAQFYERRINIAFARASSPDIRRAIDAFQRLLADDPLSTPAAAAWNPDVVSDIRQLRVSAQIGLANLYFLSDRYSEAGTLYSRTVESGSLSLHRAMDARLGAARSLYLAGETSAVMEQCAAIFHQLLETPDFWGHDSAVNEDFLNVPVALVRMYVENGDSARANEYARLAAVFYARLASERPKTRLGWQARLGAIQLHLVRREWNAAVDAVDSVLADPSQQAGAPDGLMLLAAEIHGFALDDTSRAYRALGEVIHRFAGTGSASAARYDIGTLRAAHGDPEGATLMFRAVESDPNAEPAIAARATVSHAAILERQGDWDGAFTLLKRVQLLYPYTDAAIDAPMAITRHYARMGETQLARRSLDRARDYYLSLLDKASQFAGDRSAVQTAMVESYVAAGRAADVAELLGSGRPGWDETSVAAGMLRSADVYTTVLHDSTQACAVLKKCVERFPKTQYSKMAERRLDELEGRSD